MIDDTFHRIVLRRVDPEGSKARRVYYNYVEKGGLTSEPLHAATASNVDAGLRFMTRQASKEFPHTTFEICKLNLIIEPFRTPTMMLDRLIDDDVRRTALAKLTDDEREVLNRHALRQGCA